MKTSNFKSAALVLAIGAALSLSACNVEKTQEGELPKVDVDAQGGQLPAYKVETPDVDVNTREATVPVPDVDVNVERKEAQVTVPNVDVTIPSENDAAEEKPKQ